MLMKRSLVSANSRKWISRILIGVVFIANLQCAVLFLWNPAGYAPGFELSGAIGDAIIRAIGLLFLMWNVPYAVALWNPIKHRVSLYEAVVMQSIGVIGETLLWWQLPTGHLALEATATRFIAFDAFGLLALLLAAWIVFRESEK